VRSEKLEVNEMERALLPFGSWLPDSSPSKTEPMPSRSAADHVIWVQLLKSGTSAGANSSEGPGAQSRKEWLTRRHIALKEMRESHFWLRLLRDSATHPSGTTLDGLRDESHQLVAILTAAVKSAHANDSRRDRG